MSRPLPPFWVWLILPFRLAGIGLAVVIHLVFGSALLLWPMSAGAHRRAQARWVVVLCTIVRICLGVRVSVEGAFGNRPPRGLRPLLVVANHVSFLDILAMTAWQPLSYISSVDMGEAPFVGWILRSTGTVLVERRHRGNLTEDCAQVIAALTDGAPVCLYPEGTSTDGTEILRFKSGLLEGAVATRAWVLPVAIQYERLGGREITRANGDRVFFPPKMNIFEHIVNVVTNPGVRIRLNVLEPVRADAERTRRELADELRERLLRAYVPVR